MDYKYINTEYLESVAGGDKGIMIELIGLFKEQVNETVNEMDSLLKKGDYYSLGLLSHKAKSSVAIMGMEDLAAMLKTFELQAKSGEDTDKYEMYITRFKEETANAIAELEILLENL
jgi:HPt (histidine-containing phosphotransfer) domain-containing protein